MLLMLLLLGMPAVLRPGLLLPLSLPLHRLGGLRVLHRLGRLGVLTHRLRWLRVLHGLGRLVAVRGAGLGRHGLLAVTLRTRVHV
ncbi:hypothetical protein N8J89_04745 [Crossiella sp. CA-258035]|uniref:hypothetical protein n=1 Tax=Crossiella sp. CA-258035 TaxID=2981138 RepID=UPI0024BBF37F|nr:hypothetical protein [Crossiella sp. CA-258035]WHT23784.1 hypothetical protein N8J89_04745 [Crossiella sp. CA-258035]